ncbi:hypothetical protein LXL04_006459 [Taraxacum kok-saghyz]
MTAFLKFQESPSKLSFAYLKFLEGLAVYGKGDWVSISRHSVITKTSTQVASHAQKYFLRQKVQEKDKKRASIYDITTAELLPPTNIYRHQGGGGGGGDGGGVVGRGAPPPPLPQNGYEHWINFGHPN